MIGQKYLWDKCESLISSKTFPRFVILVGTRGSGRTTLARQLAKKLTGFNGVEISVAIADIREMIYNSYKVSVPTVYIISNADNMSLAAKNALLKVTEEPPNSAYFIMTLEDINNTLDTIRSRATVFEMDPYTPQELSLYYEKMLDYYKKQKPELTEIKLVTRICDTPGQIDLLVSTCKGDIFAFYDYVSLVVKHIANVSLANAFKIPSKVTIKEGSEGYDLRLFLQTFDVVCMDNYFETSKPEYLLSIATTAQVLEKLRIKGINRQMLLDKWLMDVRANWGGVL